MEWSLRELRTFVTAVEAGSLTDAAAELRISQAQVSRTVAALERHIGQRVLHRIPHGCEPTKTGLQLLPHARRLLAEADRLSTFMDSRHQVLRVGYAWAALGRHTATLQRDWDAERTTHQGVELQLIRYNTPTAGLAEGVCDVAIIRRPVDDRRFSSAVVGLEDRLAVFPSDDPRWARRRRLTMAEIAQRTVIIDPRTGTTSSRLWDGAEQMPQFEETGDVDSWLDTIAAGHGVGTTAEATAYHHPRPGISYRPIKDGPRIPVRLVWWSDEPPVGIQALVDAVTQLYASGTGAAISGGDHSRHAVIQPGQGLGTARRE
ncbi:MAG: LysR family transcriptional regulator [Acidipropionibacterium sp.]|jgi:DNA-binding transcriptional LysR family regulator|nr:LysR family transcriptional regulator [Acidipropionibacterium sp.]